MARPDPRAPQRTLRLDPLTEADLDLVADTEKRAYTHPWTLGHFRDSWQAGHPARLLTTPPLPGDVPLRLTAQGQMLLGYWVAMPGVEEMHLLNLVVAPEHRRQGWGHTLMQALVVHSLQHGAQTLWLEVRASNRPAQCLYQRTGFKTVGVRKGYYPAGHGSARTRG